MVPIPTDHDVIHNKINLLTARNQRFVQSWPSLKQTFTWQPAPEAKPEEKIKGSEEEHEIFTPMPELLGLGRSLDTDGEMRNQGPSSDENLRKRLLGKDFVKNQEKKAKSAKEPGTVPLPVGSKPRPTATKRAAESDSDDVGRSSLGNSRQDRKQSRIKQAIETNVDVGEVITQLRENGSSKSRPLVKASNYLDEVLADQSLRKRRKSERKKKKEATAEDLKQDS